MSLGSILNIARGAISAHQIAMQTVSQNIANAEVEGYSRQRAEMQNSYAIQFPQYTLGTGVEVRGIVRMRDQLLDASYRREVGNREAYNVRSDLLTEVESLLGEPSETGLANTIDQFSPETIMQNWFMFDPKMAGRIQDMFANMAELGTRRAQTRDPRDAVVRRSRRMVVSGEGRARLSFSGR